MAFKPDGFSERKSPSPSLAHSSDEDPCFNQTSFVRATTIGSSVSTRYKEHRKAADLRSSDSFGPRRRKTSAVIELDDDEGANYTSSVSDTRKVWQTSTSTVLQATGRKKGANNAMVSQVASLIQDLQDHFDQKLENAVYDIKGCFESSLNVTTGDWQRGESGSSGKSEDRGTHQSNRGRMDDDQQYKSEPSICVLGGLSASSRDLQLPADVKSHIHNSGYSMEDIQRAQERHFLGIFRAKRLRNRGSTGSDAKVGNFVSALPGIRGGRGSSSEQLAVMIESCTLEEDLPTKRPLSILLLRIWGLLAWSQSSRRRRILSFMYQAMVVLLALSATGLQIRETVAHQAAEPSLDVEYVGYLIVSIGASLGLIQAQRLARVCEIAGVLATEGTEKRLFYGLVSNNDVGALLYMVAFALIVITSVVRPHDPGQTRNDSEYLLRVIFLKGLLCSVNFFIFMIAQAMKMTAEGFCRDFMRKPHFGEAIESWGSIETLLNKLCKDLAAALLTLVLTAIGIIATFFFKPHEPEAQLDLVLYESLHLLILPIYVFTTISQAAEVTETCTRVPPLVNSLNFGVQLDVDRLYLVQYIVHSGAGFYFNKIRLTGSMVTKAAYVMGLLMLSVLTGANPLKR